MTATRISEFDTWQAGYAGASVRIEEAGTGILADVFTDEALTIAADNPQTLLTETVSLISYGKFAAPLYVGASYELVINSLDRTGVIRLPITTLDGEDASEAEVTVTGGSEAIALDDHLARRIDPRDYGELLATGAPGASASTNAATITTAMGVAAAAGGGFVELPGGTYAFTSLTLPQGVVLRGQGRAATTLQSTTAGNVLTASGARAGLTRLTLDGVSKAGGSVGLYAANVDEIVLDDVEIKRFETGISRKGGTRAAWVDLYISNCGIGYAPYGDAASGLGGAIRFNSWRGGKIELCSVAGINLKYVDQVTEHNQFHSVIFDTNTGNAVWIRGARNSAFLYCRWTDNTNNLTVADATPVTTLNTVIGLDIIGGQMSGGTVSLSDTLDLVAFRQMAFTSVTVTLTSPVHNVHVEDCRENSVTIGGNTTAWRRRKTSSKNSAAVTTTDATVTKAWATTLAPGEHVRLNSKVVGRQLNGTGYYFVHESISARRPGSTLNYQTQTGNFTLGQMLTGATSGATARIVADVDAGATGVLTLYDILGTFVNGEIISDPSGGSATTNGTVTDHLALVLSNQVLVYDMQTVNFTIGQTVTGALSGATARIVSDVDGGASGTLTVTDAAGIFIAGETINDGGGAVARATVGLANTGWTAGSFDLTNSNYVSTFYGVGGDIELRVAGVANHTIEWTADVEVVSNFHAVV